VPATAGAVAKAATGKKGATAKKGAAAKNGAVAPAGAGRRLVIVESPAKARTIAGYLGQKRVRRGRSEEWRADIGTGEHVERGCAVTNGAGQHVGRAEAGTPLRAVGAVRIARPGGLEPEEAAPAGRKPYRPPRVASMCDRYEARGDRGG